MPNTSPFSDDPKPIADAASLFDTDELRTLGAPPPVSPPAAPKPTSKSTSDTDEIRVLDPSGPTPAPEAGPNPASKAGFDTDEILALIPPVADPSPAAGPKPTAPAPEGDDGYGLIGGPAEVGDEEPPRPVELPTPTKKARRRPAGDDGPSASTRRPIADEDEAPATPSRRRRPAVEFDDISEVDEDDSGAVAYPLWSRWAEWGGTVVRVAAVFLATLFVAGAIFQSVHPMLGFLVFLLGCAGAVLLSYPIVITMERPVRITPEQAVKDFYAAASHHFPHYKRMWLLLSSAGRESGPFGSFGEFRSAWEKQIAAWKGGDKSKKYTPLDFRIQNFQADKSVGQTSVWAEYTLRVRLREQEGGDHALATIRMAHGLVKGEDRMWYLNQGFPSSSDGD